MVCTYTYKGKTYERHEFEDVLWFMSPEEAAPFMPDVKPVPEAPLISKWPELAMRRMVRWAAENGYDRLAWTTGEQQAERYKAVMRNVRALSYDAKRRELTAALSDGTQQVIPDVDQARLANAVGKETAQQLLASPARDSFGPVRDTYLLKAPPEGFTVRTSMTGKDDVYDVRAVKDANRLGKEFGAQVGETRINTGKRNMEVGLTTDADDPARNGWYVDPVYDGPSVAGPFATRQEAEAELARLERGGLEPVHSLDITPEMRESVTERGLALFPLLSGEAPSEFSRTAVRGAAGGAASGASQASEENASPEEIAAATAGGALLGAVPAGTLRLLEAGPGIGARLGGLARLLSGGEGAAETAPGLVGRRMRPEEQRAAGQTEMGFEAATPATTSATPPARPVTIPPAAKIPDTDLDAAMAKVRARIDASDDVAEIADLTGQLERMETLRFGAPVNVAVPDPAAVERARAAGYEVRTGQGATPAGRPSGREWIQRALLGGDEALLGVAGRRMRPGEQRAAGQLDLFGEGATEAPLAAPGTSEPPSGLAKLIGGSETVKQPWEMTRAEYQQAWISDTVLARRPEVEARALAEDATLPERQGMEYSSGEGRQILGAPNLARQTLEMIDARVRVAEKRHRRFVEQALSEGKPVPAEVLAEYPDLAKQYQREAKP